MTDQDKDKTRDGSEEKRGVSRRKWLIDIGKAAALAGIAAKSGAVQANVPSDSANTSAKPEELPPGLFRPLPEHLGHALVNDSRFRAIPAGCPVDFVRPPAGSFEPQFFSRDEYKVIHRMTALMLGVSPVAPEEADGKHDENIVDEVAEWIDLRTFSFAVIREAAARLTPEQIALAEAYDGAPLLNRIKTSDPQKTYRDGLAWIEEESKRRHQRSFVELSEDQQAAILDLISDDRAENAAENAGTLFFRQLKNDVISGFYTSKTGLQELDNKRNQFYAESPGCPSSRR